MTKESAEKIVCNWLKACDGIVTDFTVGKIAGDIGLSIDGAIEFIESITEERLNFLLPDRKKTNNELNEFIKKPKKKYRVESKMIVFKGFPILETQKELYGNGLYGKTEE